MTSVSVIIPSYNSADYVREAINSVLAQTFGDVEILVVDDGSTDETSAVVKTYDSRVRYIWQENAGVAAARNRGMAESNGRYIAFLDADDTWLPTKLDTQLNAMEKSPESRVCYSAFLSVTSELEPIGITRSNRKGRALDDLLLLGNVVGSICTVIVDAALIKRVGGFDAELSQCADWDMWVRLAAESEFLYIDEPLVTYRQHNSNMSRNAPLLEKDSLRVLEKGFEMPDLEPDLRSERRCAFGRNYMVLAGTYFQAGDYLDFLRCAMRSLVLDPSQAKYLAQFPIRVAARTAGAR